MGNYNVEQDTVGEISAADFRKVKVFEKYGIDFCCNGDTTLLKACENVQADVNMILEELLQIDNTKQNSEVDYNSLSVSALVDRIITIHHNYVRENTPVIRNLLDKVIRVHGDNNPELLKIGALFNNISNELVNHMHKEEMILFPYIKHLNDCNNAEDLRVPPFVTIKNPINMMEAEHDSAGNSLHEIRTLSNQYVMPEGACMSYWSLYNLLKEFDNDLTTHIHLENNILFPKAIELENELVNKLA